MSYTVLELSPEALMARRDDLMGVYKATFSQPPYRESPAKAQAFGQTLPETVGAPGFRSAVAREEDSGRLVGFAFGWTSHRGHWWRDAVEPLMGPRLARTWLSDCFEFVELAVVPRLQRQGLGSRLHDALLEGLPHRTAVLSTLLEALPALRFYRKKGWRPVLPEYTSPSGRRCVVLGRELAGTAPSPRRSSRRPPG